MRYWLGSLLALLLLASPCYATGSPESKTQLYSEVTTNFPDNTVGSITPAKLRTVIDNVIASMQQLSLVNAQTGTSYTIAVSDQGKLLTLSNGAAIAVTIPAGSTTGNGWAIFVKNNGVGTATITPVSGTINGAASATLGTGQGLMIASDGINYQTWGGSGTGTVTSVTCGKNLSGGVITLSGTCALLDAITLGTSGSIIGVLKQAGNTSGEVTVTPQATAGTPTITWPTSGGTVVTSAASPLSINGTTGLISSTTGTLSKVDDTNVTLTLGGTPTNSMFNNVSMTLGWANALAVARGGTACTAASGTCLDNITGFTSFGIMSRQASGYTFSTFSTLMDSGVCSTQGSVAYRNASLWVCITPGTSGQVLATQGAGQNPVWFSVAGTGTVTSVTCGTGLTGGTFSSTGTCAVDISTSNDIWARTSSKIIDASQAASSLKLIPLVDASTIAVDMNTFINASVTLGGNRTLGNPSNISGAEGRCGRIYFTQDSTGTRTLAYSSNWKFAGGSAPTLSTSGGSIDMLVYCVRTTTAIDASLNKDFR